MSTLKFNEYQNSVLNTTEKIKVYCKCSKCGKKADVDTSTCLTSNPPQYNYHCPHCDKYGYVLCNEVFYEDTKEVQIETIPIPTEPIGLAAPCLICGDTVIVSIWDNHSKICEKCKKAVLKVRKMLEEE